MPPSDLAAATRVTPVAHAPGWYTADLPNAWSYLTPSGGVLMTVAMRAMAAELGDDALHPVSATTVFMSRVPAGPLAVRVEVLRSSVRVTAEHARAFADFVRLCPELLPAQGALIALLRSRGRELPERFRTTRDPTEDDNGHLLTVYVSVWKFPNPSVVVF